MEESGVHTRTHDLQKPLVTFEPLKDRLRSFKQAVTRTPLTEPLWRNMFFVWCVALAAILTN